MVRESLSVQRWQDRLKAHFTHNEVVGGELVPLLDMESAAGEKFIEKYFGHSRLSDCSQSFALQTLQRITPEIISHGSKISPFFQPIFIDFVLLFRRFRAASTLAMNGTLGFGFTLQRVMFY